MSDLVDRLRAHVPPEARHGTTCMEDDLLEAADEIERLRKDAERYRWLREQQWSSSPVCVVADPKRAVKIGHTCPSREYLDIEIDAAMQTAIDTPSIRP